MSFFISDYRQNYSTQYVSVCYLEECWGGIGSNFVVGDASMNLSKAFPPFPSLIPRSNDLFFIFVTSAHNLADDNSLSNIATNLDNVSIISN